MERVEAVLRAYYLMEIRKDFCVSMDYPRKHYLTAGIPDLSPGPAKQIAGDTRPNAPLQRVVVKTTGGPV